MHDFTYLYNDIDNHYNLYCSNYIHLMFEIYFEVVTILTYEEKKTNFKEFQTHIVSVLNL